MDLRFSDELERFRAELRRFLAAKMPRLHARAGVRSPEPHEIPIYKQWVRDLFEAGYLGASWPKEWGGRPERDPLEDFIVDQELARAGAPRPIGAFGLAAGAILEFGSRAQQERHLPRIRRADDLWCQLFSEPNAGSDLASLQTRARRDGDHYVVDGQKVWSTQAHVAELGYLLARSEPDAPKHAGITAFVLDMKTPGVEVRPLREITGTSDFNEVFLSGVRIPAENAIGKPGEGWMVATASLVHERAGVAAGGIRLERNVRELVELARRVDKCGAPALEDSAVRQELARLHARMRVLNWMSFVRITRELKKEFRVEDAPIGKVLYSELNHDIAKYGVELQGAEGVLTEGDSAAHEAGRWQDEFLYARAYTIAGGANEVMRNMIAERGLGMPRDPKGK